MVLLPFSKTHYRGDSNWISFDDVVSQSVLAFIQYIEWDMSQTDTDVVAQEILLLHVVPIILMKVLEDVSVVPKKSSVNWTTNGHVRLCGDVSFVARVTILNSK